MTASRKLGGIGGEYFDVDGYAALWTDAVMRS